MKPIADDRREMVDRLLREGVKIKEITEITGYSSSFVYSRKLRVGMRTKGGWMPREDCTYRPASKPSDRLNRVIRHKARLIGMPVDWVRKVWVPKHPEFLQEYPVR